VETVEALIRWNHSVLGAVSPGQFIPLAENLGLIEQIDEWVLDQVCKRSAAWQAAGSDVVISVNVSGRSFNNNSFVDGVVKALLKKHQISGESLEFEITEGVLLTDTQRMLQRLRALKSAGIKLALDDFGCGFSSLSYLKHFPIDTLKIDGSFVCETDSGKKEKALLKAIIALGKALEMKVVAECIETKAQAEYLTKLGCNEGQGYYWFRPSADWKPDPACEKSLSHINSQEVR